MRRPLEHPILLTAVVFVGLMWATYQLFAIAWFAVDGDRAAGCVVGI